MAATITVNTLTSPLPRDELARFLPSPRAVRAFEGMQADVTQTFPDAMGEIIDLTNSLLAAPYITWAESPTLESERTLSVTSTLRLTNDGSQVILGLAETGFLPGFYGSATQTLGIQVDLFGRVIGAEAYDLVTDNVTEGGANLYYTDTRARAALSGGAGIDYDPGTGQIATASGTYMPTATGIANVTAATPTDAAFYRIGNVVTVFGIVTVTPTAAATLTRWRMTIPVPSDLGAPEAACGSGSIVNPPTSVVVFWGGTAGQVEMRFTSTGTTAVTVTYQYSYRIT